MTDPDAWLAANTFHCERHNAKLQTSSCERYQAIEPDRCRGCVRAGNVPPMEKAVRKQLRRHKVEPKVVPAVPCVKCHRVRKILAKGLCASCYNTPYAAKSNVKQREQRALTRELIKSMPATPAMITINLTIAPADAAELLNFIAGLKPLVGGAA